MTPLPPDSRRLRVAAVLEVLGYAGLPVGVGMGIGYWISDAGVPWLPNVVDGLIVLGFLSLALMLGALRLKRNHIEVTAAGQRVRKRVAFLFFLFLVAAAAWTARQHAVQPAPLTLLSPAVYGQAFAVDADRFVEHSTGIATMVTRLESHPAMGEDAGVMGADEEVFALATWMAILDYTAALEGTREFHEDWYRFDPSRFARPRLLRSFLLSTACELALAESAARLGQVVRRNDSVRAFLDTPHPSAGLPGETFSRWSQAFEGGETQARLLGAAQTLKWMEDVMSWRPDAFATGEGWLWTDVEDRLDRLAGMGLLDRTAAVAAGEGEALRRVIKRSWLPAQTEVALWFGNTKLRRNGWFLITPAQQEVLDRELVPGDLLVTRKNWYMSNVGLPGWWPHGILYIGAPDKLAAWADDDEVRALVEELAGRPMSLPDYLAAEHPDVWTRYARGQRGQPFRLIEGHKPGITLSTLADSSGDSLAALRPRVGKRAKAHAVIEAFSHVGKPYDFDFDFATEHALVCTELIWRSYRPAEGKDGLDLTLVDVAGRQTLPAIELVNRYITERGQPDRMFDFVYFLDAREDEQLSVISTEEEFITTPLRGKWIGG